MLSADTKAVIERAKRIYAEQLQTLLEPQHLNRFVAIEPDSGEYFLGDTFRRGSEVGQGEVPVPGCPTLSGSGIAPLSPRRRPVVKRLRG